MALRVGGQAKPIQANRIESETVDPDAVLPKSAEVFPQPSGRRGDVAAEAGFGEGERAHRHPLVHAIVEDRNVEGSPACALAIQADLELPDSTRRDLDVAGNDEGDVRWVGADSQEDVVHRPEATFGTADVACSPTLKDRDSID